MAEKRAPWGHVPRHCIYCGKVGPRTVVLGGYAHKRCMPKPARTPSGKLRKSVPPAPGVPQRVAGAEQLSNGGER